MTWLLSVLLALILLGIVAVLVMLWRRGSGMDNGSRGLSDVLGEQREHLLQNLNAQANTIKEMTEQSLNRHFGNVDRKLSENKETTHSLLKNLGERLKLTELLNENVSDLHKTLADKQRRGAFGELRLEQIVKDQLPSEFYRFQATLENGNRADCLIKLPPPTKPICIDAKFPLSGYDGGGKPQDHNGTPTAKKTFEATLRTHVNDIAAKYIVPGVTEDHAGMFLPSEGLYILIYDEFPKLAEYARKMRVVLLSPGNLWLTLNTMGSLIKDIKIHEKAKLIQKEVGALLLDTARIGERSRKLQSHFDLARRDLDELGISVRKVGDRSDRIKTMDFEEAKKLAED